MGTINSPDNGATEVYGTTHDSKVVFLGSPIRYWWTVEDGHTLHETYRYKLYADFREGVRNMLSQEFMVYSPHLALRGPWNEMRGTALNDFALMQSDAFVQIDAGVPMLGTDHERELAENEGIPVYTIHYGRHPSDLGVVFQQMKEDLL